MCHRSKNWESGRSQGGHGEENIRVLRVEKRYGSSIVYSGSGGAGGSIRGNSGHQCPICCSRDPVGDGRKEMDQCFLCLVSLVIFLSFFTISSHQELPQTNLSPSSSFSLTQLISCLFYSIHKLPLGLFPVSSNAQLPTALSPNLIYLNQPSIFASCGSLCQTGFSGLV